MLQFHLPRLFEFFIVIYNILFKKHYEIKQITHKDILYYKDKVHINCIIFFRQERCQPNKKL